MAEYLKPNSPIKYDSDTFIYPLTYFDQIIMSDGSRWDGKGGVTSVNGLTGDVTLTASLVGAAASSHSHNYLPLSGGTLTGELTLPNWISSATNYITFPFTKGTAPSTITYREIKFMDNVGTANVNSLGSVGCSVSADNEVITKMNVYAPVNGSSASANIYIKSDADGVFSAGCSCAFYGAVWNDYAECRASTNIKPGFVLTEKGDDTLELADGRMLPACSIVSDTFGFCIGETEQAKTPIAVCGRVLAYCSGDRNDYQPGDAVCSDFGGKVTKMTREEIKEYPDRIIGYVSCVPTYDTWGENNVKVDGRIWVKVK